MREGNWRVLWLITIASYTLTISALRSNQVYAEKSLRHHYRLIGGLTLARAMNDEDRRLLPWRQVERSTLAPLRADYALSYDWGESAQWGVIAGVRLARAGLEQEGITRPLSDPRGRGPALGELSMRYGRESAKTPERFQLKAGVFTLSLQHATWDRLNQREVTFLEQSLWSIEEPTWSESASPLDRYVTGLSLRGVVGRESSPLWSYRLSIATPTEGRLGPLSSLNGGILLDTAFSRRSSQWKLHLNAIAGYGLPLPPSAKVAVDQQLEIMSVLGRRSPLALRDLHRDVLWLRARIERSLQTISEHQVSAFSIFESRSLRLDQALGTAEVAALSESNLVGSGAALSTGLRGLRAHRAVGPRGPDELSIAYEWRDPERRFAYDERHRLRVNIAYYGERSSLHLWWSHPWSNADHRWRFRHDLVGLSLLWSHE